MIPIDVITLIIEYSHLCLRYRWSVVQRQFRFTDTVWQHFGRHYGLTEPTRLNVQNLCERGYDAQHQITRQLCHLWSNHLREPLMVWSPWTPSKFCNQSPYRLFFRKYSFVDFVRNLINQFQLESSSVRVWREYGPGVSVNIWKKRVPMVYISQKTNERRHKIHISSAFKKICSARALIAFHVAADKLHLSVRGLEFLV